MRLCVLQTQSESRQVLPNCIYFVLSFLAFDISHLHLISAFMHLCLALVLFPNLYFYQGTQSTCTLLHIKQLFENVCLQYSPAHKKVIQLFHGLLEQTQMKCRGNIEILVQIKEFSELLNELFRTEMIIYFRTINLSGKIKFY